MAARDPLDINSLLQLIIGGLNGQLDEAEARQLQDWLEASEDNRLLYQELSDEAQLAGALTEQRQFNAKTALRRVRSRIQGLAPAPRPRSFPWLKVAAAVLLLFSLGMLLWKMETRSKDSTHALATDIPPGTNKATLTLPNGKMVELDSAQSGIIVLGQAIVYNDKSPLNVTLPASGAEPGSEIEKSLPDSPNFLTLSTPKGGVYQIILSDGTKVWLNAASTLTYPSKFNGDTRTVELDGEAYFKVDKLMDQKPFIVKSRKQYIRVLGTEFNLNSYSDEKYIKTTLITGAVQVSGVSAIQPDKTAVKLVPGKQSINIDGLIQVKDADIKSEIAWKNGMFRFQGITLSELMRQISRWYKINVDVQGTAGQRKIFGEIYRNYTLLQVLEVLEELEGGNVKFTIIKEDGAHHKLIVRPK